MRVSKWIGGNAFAAAVLLVVTMVGDGAAYGDPPARLVEKGNSVRGVPTTPARPVTEQAWRAEKLTTRGARRVDWPSGEATAELVSIDTGSGAVTAATGPVKAGRLPVAFSRTGADTDPGDGVARASVRVAERAATAKAGVSGLLLVIGRTDGRAGESRVGVEVGYGGFANAYGGDWSTRLRLTLRPACALSTPDRAECQTVSVLPTTNNLAGKTLSAQVPLSGGKDALLGVESEPSGQNGDYGATSLALAGTWDVSAQTGDFSYSYPMRMPPSLGGPSPKVSLGYASGSIDGRNSTSNNQGGWVGDGWDFWPGFIERKYASCNDDNPGHKTGDQCWFSSNATLSMNGRAGELVETGTPDVWRLRNDDGTRVQRLVDAARANGDDDSEYWKVTTTDGVQYFFGYHRLPGWASGNLVTDSTWTVPVYGNTSGEPCHGATFAGSWCQQAWRWNLDYVVDPNGNTMAYFYKKEPGWYGRDLQANQRTEYVRGGWLDRIEYGMRYGAEYASAAPLRVLFKADERCLAGCWTGTPWESAAVESAWPDTPWDQHCAASPCTNKLSPAFWSARRLTKVTTQVRSGVTSYRDVESWTLRQEFLNAGDNEGFPMWLRGITHAGLVTTAGGAVETDPEVVFDPGAEPLPNRVDGPGVGMSSLTRFRIKRITNEAGGQINVDYQGADCSRGSPPVPESNTTRCMPVLKTQSPDIITVDWFHKYRVIQVNLHDVQYVDGNGVPVAVSEDQSTFYDYLDSPAWHYTDGEITPTKYRTWSAWRGYGRVQVRKGSPTGQQTAVEYRYMRGMDGDKQPSGTRDVWVPDTWGGTIEDHEAHAGFLRQKITFNGPNGAEVESAVYDPWRLGPTATRDRGGVITNAWVTQTGTTRTRTALYAKDGSSRGFRTAKTSTAFNAEGLAVSVDEFGDENATGDETCTRKSYARNESTWMIDKVAQEETLSGTCAAAATPAVPSTVLKRSRTFYDTYTGESSFGAPPTEGNPVRTEELDSFSGSTPSYVATAANTFDDNGRITESVDARGFKTTTERVTDAATGLVTSTKVKNPLLHETITAKEPAWDLPTKITDANGVVTDLTYDGLGRLKAVWLPGRDKASNHNPSAKYTYLVRSTGGPTAVTTEKLLPANTYRKTVNLFDGFLRVRQTQQQATGGGRTITDTLQNAMGKTATVTAPYYDGTGTPPGTTMASDGGVIPSSTVSVYDGAGRVTDEIFRANEVEDWRTTTVYGGDRTFVTPREGGIPTTTITDAHGNTTALRQYKAVSSLGSDDPATFTLTSSTHTLLGQPATITDQAGNVWQFDHDLRGRQWRSVEPDKGVTTTTFDAAGNPQTVTSQLGTGTATLAYTYDELGRKTTMRDDSVAGQIRAQWVYDQTPIVPDGTKLAKGKLTSATRLVSGNAYTTRIDSYDQYSRVKSTSVVLPSSEGALCAAAAPNPCAYTTTFTYTITGQVTVTAMPAAAGLAKESVTSGFTDVGNEGTMYSAIQAYVGVGYNQLDQLTDRQLGPTGNQLVQHYDYDEPTRRLTTASHQPTNLPEVARYNYTYDDAGNIRSVTDEPVGQTVDRQCFRYGDHLRRLTDAWTPLSSDCNTDPTTAGLSGPAPYWYSWEFDDLGNRKKEIRHATGGNTTYTYTYPASGPTSVRPHAVTSITAAGGVSWTRGYTYDNGGNTKTRPNGAGVTQTLTYDREGHLDTLVQGSATTGHIYDAEGNRLIRVDPDGSKILYMGATEVKVVGTVATATRYYSHAGTVICSRTTAGLNWIVGDHHGTAEFVVKASDLTTTAKRRTTPYGQIRGTTGTWPGGMDKGFVGGTADPTELTHLGAREYDPFTGQFASVDPVLDTKDPQQMHGYAYSHNSPVTQSDPSGLYDCGDLNCNQQAHRTSSGLVVTGDPVDETAPCAPHCNPKDYKPKVKPEPKKPTCSVWAWICKGAQQYKDSVSKAIDFVTDPEHLKVLAIGLSVVSLAVSFCFLPACTVAAAVLGYASAGAYALAGESEAAKLQVAATTVGLIPGAGMVNKIKAGTDLIVKSTSKVATTSITTTTKALPEAASAVVDAAPKISTAARMDATQTVLKGVQSFVTAYGITSAYCGPNPVSVCS